MNHKKRFGDSEINLTPLLDVLFSILFIIMLSSAGNEARTRAEAKAEVEAIQEQMETERVEMNKSIEEMASEAEEVREQARIAEGRLEDYEIYRQEAVIVSVQNTIEAGEHVLKIFVNEDENPYETLKLGLDLTDYTKKRVKSIISELVANVDNAPVFIIFRCEKRLIYTIEYNALNDALNELQDGNKEVFYKRIMQ